MPRNSSSVKAADIYQKKTKAKVIDWEPRKHSRGVRDVPVEVIATASQTRPRKKASRRPRAQNNDTLQGEAAPQPMDIDETFWAEEPVMAAGQKRVSQPACPSLVYVPHISLSLSMHTLKNSSPKLALICAAFSTLRASRRRPHVRAAGLLHSSGSVPTAFLHLFFVRSAAESHTSFFLFTEFKNGLEITSCHRGCGRLGCACNLGTLGTHVQIKLYNVKIFIL